MIHYYYGDGKGKSSSANGLLTRAIGRKKTFLLTRFFKDGIKDSGEDNVFKQFGKIMVLKFDYWVDFSSVKPEEKESITTFFDEIKKYVEKNKPEIIILDEIIYALYCNAIDNELFVKWLENAKKTSEVILTGRYKIDSIIKVADYVSHIKAEKHPYEQGVDAREGIEY